MAGLTLDAGALIAYERGQERIREILAVSYERGFVPTIPGQHGVLRRALCGLLLRDQPVAIVGAQTRYEFV